MPNVSPPLLVPGIYEQLLDEELKAAIEVQPELSAVFGKLDNEDAPHAYSQFLVDVISQALRNCQPARRIALVNRLVNLICATDGLDYLSRRTLIETEKPLLLTVQAPAPDGKAAAPLARPLTPLGTSSLLTGSRQDPPLEHEIRQEMLTSDRVDILVSFVKWSGLRLLEPAFADLEARKVPVRIVTTSYMGASDPEAIASLAARKNFSVKVSYDTQRTRLHAKAYHFFRGTGFSTAYIGSANMSHAAMTSGLEWTVKVTARDMSHILQRFEAEFATYWSSAEFETYDPSQEQRLREAISYAKPGGDRGEHRFFADITPHPFQDRILDALAAARLAGQTRNLVVAATGTGKTIVAAFDYRRFAADWAKAGGSLTRRPPLLFVAHRREILQQARDCFRTVLRDANFGELLVDGDRPRDWVHVFASVQSVSAIQLWTSVAPEHYAFIVIDEAHHSTANSYRPILENFRPEVLLGLTATPERMDGSSILPDFGGQFAAEIRLPEALEEKLLCPFHYFGITDPVSLDEERFWRNGKYDVNALTDVYTGDDLRARQRLGVILESLKRYQPDLSRTRAIGFCASVKHARFMAKNFSHLQAAVIVGETPTEQRAQLLADFRAGRIRFIFTVDVFSEGVDVPEINLVMFLRPTESLTIFLQQLGRGLRHHPEKDCLTVLDFIGQQDRRYRIDRKFAALLTRDRQRMDLEVENDFPHLPPGCNIQLERIAREHVLSAISEGLGNFQTFVLESLTTFEKDHQQPLNFTNFVQATGVSPLAILSRYTWSHWKALATQQPIPKDPDLHECRKSLRRVLLRTDPTSLEQLDRLAVTNRAEDVVRSLEPAQALGLHYLLWADTGKKLEVESVEESLAKWHRNESARRDLQEVVAWRRRQHVFATREIKLPFPCGLHLHAAYGALEIKAALGLSTFHRKGPTGVGVMPVKALRCYVHLVTFRKSDADFSPTTRYRDYPISRTELHWETQSGTSQESPVGQNYLNFKDRGYTILFFARLERKIEDETAPFVFLGQAKRLISAKGNRPIAMVWELEHPMPAVFFEEARAV
jgi:superfamily II DNA or RNA helicase